MTSPKDIIESSTTSVRRVLEEILLIEKEHQYIQNLEKNTAKEKEIAIKIAGVISKEADQ